MGRILGDTLKRGEKLFQSVPLTEEDSRMIGADGLHAGAKLRRDAREGRELVVEMLRGCPENVQDDPGSSFDSDGAMQLLRWVHWVRARRSGV